MVGKHNIYNIYNKNDMAVGANYNNRRFVIFEVTELGVIDFSQVDETSASTVRKSVDGLETFVKYDLPMPSSVIDLTTKSQEYTYDEILVILSTPEWSAPFPTE